MAEQSRAGTVFWQAWALAALVMTAFPVARLTLPRHAAAPPRARAVEQRLTPKPNAVPSLESAVSDEHGARSRLAVAETAAERCDLLGRLQAAADPAVTYAITSVLDGAQLGAVRACATQALALQPTAEAESWLIDLSDDPAAEVRDAALQALAARDDPAALAVVVEATHAESLEPRLSAAIALLKAGRPEGFSAAMAVLPEIEGREALSSLIDALGESHDPRALPALQTLLDSADRDSQMHAIQALGELGVPAARSRLEALLEFGSQREFRAAAEALVKLSPERALAQLRLALSSSDSERQILALNALTDLNLPEVVPILQQQLASGDRVRERTVLRRLARKPLPEFETELAEFAASDDNALRGPALRALEKLGTPSAHATLQRLGGAAHDKHQTRSLLSLARDDSEAAQAELLRRIADPTRTAAALGIVVESAPGSTVLRIVEQAGSLNTDDRRELIQGLAQRGDPRFAEVLRDAQHDPDSGTRNGALRGLIELGDESALADAERMAKASTSEERAVAVDLLATRTDQDTEREIEALATDSDVGVVSSALHVMQGRAPDRVSSLALRAFQGASAEDRLRLLSDLNDLKSSVLRPLYELALREGDDAAAEQAIRSLAGLEGPESAGRLAAVLNDANRSAEVRTEAASGLRDLGGPLARSNRTLIDSLSDPANQGQWVCELHP